MKALMATLCFFLFVGVQSALASNDDFIQDHITTVKGELTITFLQHASLMLAYHGRIIHVDPVSRMADYSKLPKAELILITHEHADHFDEDALKQLIKPGTEVIMNAAVSNKGIQGKVLKNGESTTAMGLPIRAVAAYNIVHKRENGEPYHPKGRDNGFIVSFADIDLYIAGDTENIPEMKALTGIDIAFLPMNLPYTMSPEMVNDAVRIFKPAVLYPYHYKGTNPDSLATLLNGQDHTELRVRKLYDE